MKWWPMSLLIHDLQGPTWAVLHPLPKPLPLQPHLLWRSLSITLLQPQRPPCSYLKTLACGILLPVMPSLNNNMGNPLTSLSSLLKTCLLNEDFHDYSIQTFITSWTFHLLLTYFMFVLALSISKSQNILLIYLICNLILPLEYELYESMDFCQFLLLLLYPQCLGMARL